MKYDEIIYLRTGRADSCFRGVKFPRTKRGPRVSRPLGSYYANSCRAKQPQMDLLEAVESYLKLSRIHMKSAHMFKCQTYLRGCLRTALCPNSDKMTSSRSRSLKAGGGIHDEVGLVVVDVDRLVSGVGYNSLC